MDASPLTRRRLLLGTAGGLLLSACGKSDGSDDDQAVAEADGSSTTLAGGDSGGALTLVPLFVAEQPVGAELRLALALADGEGTFDVDTPDEVSVRLRRPDGTQLPSQVVALHDRDLPRGYYPLRTTFDVPGRWTIEVEAGKVQVEEVVDARPPGELKLPVGRGDLLPRIPTPIRGSRRGVDRICTAEPMCPFHARSLDEVIGGDKPIVLLVATPALCAVAICGPVLDVLVEQEARLRDAGFEVVHAEPFADEIGKVSAPIVDALSLNFEPSLYLAAPDGTVTERLDLIFDRVELDEALAKLEA